MTESEARRKLENEGYALQVKRNHPDIYHNGCYHIIEVRNNSIAAGKNYDLTMEDVENFINENPKEDTIIVPQLVKEEVVKKVKEIVGSKCLDYTNREIIDIFEHKSDYKEAWEETCIGNILSKFRAVFYLNGDISNNLDIEICTELESWFYKLGEEANPDVDDDIAIQDTVGLHLGDMRSAIFDEHTYLTLDTNREILLAAPNEDEETINRKRYSERLRFGEI